jgi:hypothetical protein
MTSLSEKQLKAQTQIKNAQENLRKANGLLSNVEYVFNEDGSINWRAMIKTEHLYPNKDWFELRKLETPSTIEGLADNQLLIKLGGLKDLAKMRGFNSVSYEVIKSEKDYVVVKCKISWIGNFETSGMSIEFEDMANASLENTNDFCAKFLETIATNRAFVRCVRNFLNIHIVGDEEIDKSKNKTKSYESVEQIQVDGDISPQNLLRKHASKKLGTDSFQDFKQKLRDMWTSESYQNSEAKNWNSFKDIPAKECRKLISIIN